MGQNPGKNHPRMLSALEKCKKNGGKIVTINPLDEAGTNTFVDPQSPLAMLKGGTKLQDLFLQVKINGDVALLKAAMILMLAAEEKNPNSVFDHDFIKSHCDNYEALIQHLKTSNYKDAVIESGLPDEKVKAFAQLLIAKKKTIICWAMGITQHKNGVANVQEIVNVLLLKGSIGKPGAGTCPVRGHSNVQGDRTMGIWEKPKEAFLKELDKRFQFTAPREHGYDVVEAIKAMDEKKLKVFIGLGGNFISASPDSQFTGEAMQKCELSVQISTKLNRGHLVTGQEAIILPCISRSETDIQKDGQQFVTVENSMGLVHKSTGNLSPASKNLKSEPAIIAGIAMATLKNSPTNWEAMLHNYDEVRNHIEATIPGFEDFNKRVRISGGFSLPNGSRTRAFTTLNGKAKFTLNALPKERIKEGNFIMMTIRTHDQYNTTIYGMDDRYRGIANERRVLLMNASDMKKKGYQQEQIVNLKSHFNNEERKANNFKIVEYNIPEGCVASYFPETNVLVPLNNVAKKSNTPASKFIEVSIEA
jgi:molybdopterin-dependent oxidoreductase alpha subunit